MRPVLLWLLCVPLALSTGISFAGTPRALPAGYEEDVRRDFEAILDLWREGRYNDLYERTYAAGKQTRETFARRIAAAARRPACCWDKMQEVKVTQKNETTAALHARIGLEGIGAATEHCTKSFRLRREDGVWKASLADILLLAGSSGRKSHIHR